MSAVRRSRLTTDIRERIGALYVVEVEMRGHPPDLRHRTHQEKSRQLVDNLRAILDAALRRVAKVRHGEGIAFDTKRWPAQSRFLGDGCHEIDSNIGERALRGVAVGRRN